LFYLYKSIAYIIYLYYLCINERETIMAKTRKYKVGCSGSGWGVWEIASGKKVKGFGQRRIAALEYWYELEGWRKPAMWY
jgi:hypothetical protein